jgi:hypothetical protein
MTGNDKEPDEENTMVPGCNIWHASIALERHCSESGWKPRRMTMNF